MDEEFYVQLYFVENRWIFCEGDHTIVVFPDAWGSYGYSFSVEDDLLCVHDGISSPMQALAGGIEESHIYAKMLDDFFEVLDTI